MSRHIKKALNELIGRPNQRPKPGQRGFTLIEMLIAISIGALVISIIGMALYQISSLSIKGKDELLVQHQLQNVASWLHRDVVTASSIVVNGAAITLTIPYYEFGEDQETQYRNISYTFSDSDGTLTRSSEGQSEIVGRYIDSINFGASGTVTDTLTVTMTVEIRNSRRTSVLTLDLRPAASP